MLLALTTGLNKMSANLLELQEMLRNIDMGSVQKVASGQSGKAAQLLGMDELKRRGEQMQEAKAEEAEQGMQQPPMVDQFLAASQQMMGQSAPMPPQMMPAPAQQGIGSIPGAPYGPMSGGDPRAGSGHGMPPQMPMGQPPQQMPPQMMAGGGMVRNDLLKRPDVSNLGIVEYLMSTGMSREEAEAQARSVSGEGQQLNVGGFIQRYAPGGTVAGGDAMEYGATSQEELEENEPGFLMDSLQWAMDNPGDAALLGIDVVAAGALLAGPAGWAAGAGLKGLGMAARAARILGPKALKFLKSPVQSAGKARMARGASKLESKIDDVTDLDSARKLYQSQPGRMRTTLTGKQVPRTDAEMVSRLGKGALLPVGGAGLMGINSLVRSGQDDEEEVAAMPEGDYPDPAMPGTPGVQGPLMPTASLQVEPTGQEDPPADDPSFMDKFESGEFSDFFQFLTRTGLGLAAGKGENIGQDIAEASIGGMDYLTEMKQLEREQKRLDDAQSLRESADARDQERLGFERESQPARRDLLEAQAESYRNRGSLTQTGAANLARNLMTKIQMEDFPGGRASEAAVETHLASLLIDNGDPKLALMALYEAFNVPLPPGLDTAQMQADDNELNQVIYGG